MLVSMLTHGSQARLHCAIDITKGLAIYRLLKVKFISRLKIVQILNSHSAVQIAAVTIISYKPLSDLNFAR